MKNTCLFIVSLLCAQISFSQSAWEKKIKNPQNLGSIWEAYKSTHPNFAKPEKNKNQGEENEDGSQLFSRLFQFHGQRTFPALTPINPEASMQAYLEAKKTFPAHKKANYEASWKYSGAKVLPKGEQAGVGRINYLIIDPTNENVIYVGTPSGGLYKSTDKGLNFSMINDSLPILSSCDLVVNPRNPDSIFIATGDGFGYSIGNGDFWGGMYSYGVMVSADGGMHFQRTALNFATTDTRQIFKLVMNPKNPNVLVATSSNGIWKSTNAGKNWKNVYTVSGNKDLKMHPVDTAIYYASGSNPVYSYDGGETWKSSTFGNNSGTIQTSALAVSFANPNTLVATYTIGGVSYLSKSYDSCKTWKQQGQFVNSGLWYYMALAVSPIDSNDIIAGSVNLFRSKTGGTNFVQFTAADASTSIPYVHPDFRNIVFQPNAPDTIYLCSDGGVHKTTNDGKSWDYIDKNIQAHMIYRLHASENDPAEFFFGLQDNGLNRASKGEFDHRLRGDGMSSAVNWEDPSKVLATTQYGTLYYSEDAGNNWDYYIQPEAGNWTSPLMYSYLDPKVAYYGARTLWKSKTYGQRGTWSSSVGRNLKYQTNNNIHRISLAAKTDSFIYVSRGNENGFATTVAYVTQDMGQKWTEISKDLPVLEAFLSDLVCDRFNPNTVYATFSGYVSGKKIYVSTDAGLNWKNISGTLPNTPVNCMALEYSDKNGIYIGTDIGVFYKNDDLSDWIYFDKGMPAIIVSDLEVYAINNTVRASTFGAGIYDSKLAENHIISIEMDRALEAGISVFPNPVKDGKLTLKIPENNLGKSTLNIFDLNGKNLLTNIPLNTGFQTISIQDFPKGNYILKFTLGKYQVSKKIIVQ